MNEGIVIKTKNDLQKSMLHHVKYVNVNFKQNACLEIIYWLYWLIIEGDSVF